MVLGLLTKLRQHPLVSRWKRGYEKYLRYEDVLALRTEQASNGQLRTSCSLDFLNEIRDHSSNEPESFNPSTIFDQGTNGLSPVTPPPRRRYISPERRKKAVQSTPTSLAGTPTPAKAVFILQKSDSRESVHIDVSIIDGDGLDTIDSSGSKITSTTTLSSRSTEVCDEDDKFSQDYKFVRSRSMRGPKGLRISKIFGPHTSSISDSTAAMTLSSEDEGKGNSDQSESPPPLPPRRHRNRPVSSLSYRNRALDTNSISSEDSFPPIPCADLKSLRITDNTTPTPPIPPKSPLVTRIEVTGEPIKPTVISTEGVQTSHMRSRSEVLCGSNGHPKTEIIVEPIIKTTTTTSPPKKMNTRAKSSDNLTLKKKNQQNNSAKKSDSSDSVDEGIVITPMKSRSQSAGRARKLSEDLECYNVYNVRTGKITTSMHGAARTSAETTKRSDRHQNCKRCIHATKS